MTIRKVVEPQGERFDVEITGSEHPLMLVHLSQKLDIAREKIALRFTGSEIALLQLLLRNKLAELAAL